MANRWTRKTVARTGLVALTVFAVGVAALAFIFLGRTQVEEVRSGVHVLRTTNGLSDIGANVVVFSQDRTLVVVDAQLAPLAKRMSKILGTMGNRPVRSLVNTHWHPDHSGGNGLIAGGAPILAHPSTVARMQTAQQGFGLTKPGSEHLFEPRAAADIPTQAVADSTTVSLGTRALRVLHVDRAHTDGDLVVYDPTSRVLAVGDLVWPASFPFVDTYNGGSATGLARALDELLARTPPDAIFIPGHGPALTRSEFEIYARMVHATVAEIREFRDDGLSLEEAQTRGLSDSLTEWSSKRIPTPEWIGMVYRSLEAGS